MRVGSQRGRLRARLWLGAALLGAGGFAACAAPPADGPAATTAAADAPADDATALFVDRAAETGLVFTHFNGMTGRLLFPEPLGGGAALFDYDGDGDLDAYLVQGALFEDGTTLADALFPPTGPLTDRLFRNDLVETGRLAFTDVTEASGIDAPGYGMSATTGDYDGDGDLDLYLTNFGPNQLWRNNGDGTFTDVTAATGTDEPRWSAAATFFDADGDGDLDLFVVNYVDFNLATVKPCSSADGRPGYCGPLSYEPEPDRLFLNDGDGTFTDASGRAGIHTAYGRGLGVVAADFDDDGRTDVYVTNDGMANFLWMNEGAGRFRERAVLAGTAVNARGVAEASMGVDADDADNDGDDDLFMTHLTEESNTLYRNAGGGLFMDATAATRLGAPSLPYTGFGTAFLDADNDGWLDVIVANGAVKKILRLERAGDPYPLHEPNHFYRNRGDGTFEDATAEAGAVFARSEVSRAIAVGDVDNDGDPDVLLSNNSGPARLLVNQRGQDRHWVGLRLWDAAGRDAVGARVSVALAGGTVRHRRARTDGSYASARDPRVLVGLGGAGGPVRVVVRWPSGRREAWDAVATDRYTTLTEGTGQPVPAS